MHLFEIYIDNLEFKSIIGILDFERKKEQNIRLNAKFTYEFNGEFLDYRMLRDLILNSFKNKFDTLENALLYLQEKIKMSFKNIISFEIKITKPEIFSDCLVSVKSSYERT